MDDFDFRHLIEKVREKTNIIDVVGQRIELDRHHKALCPFHDESSASFSVNTVGQYFHCFGCGVGGDVFRFLELYEGKSFMQVLFELAEHEGIRLSQLTADDRKRIEDGRVVEDILTATTLFYHQNLTPGIRDYLVSERSFTDETIVQFQIGYANGNLRRHLIDERKFSTELCLKAGVLKRIEDDTVRDFFYDRIVFPNLKRGRVVHLSGRSLGENKPKYLHLPGEIRHLFNEDALLNKVVYLTEGIPDCITAVQAGYPAVGILGAGNFKPEYVPKFSRCETIYLCLHGDEAGREGIRKIAELLGERARVVQLPEELDINDLFKEHGNEDFDRLVESAKDVLTHELELIPEDIAKTELPKKLDPIMRRLAKADPAAAEAYLAYTIKPRFGLSGKDLTAYRKVLKEHKRADAPNVHTASKNGDLVYTANFDRLVDLVSHQDAPAFLIKDNSGLFIVRQFARDGVIHVPPPGEQIPWLLPRGDEVTKFYKLQKVLSPQQSNAALYDDLLAYHQNISELPSDEHYDLLAAWDIHTYCLEHVQHSPEICFDAVPERGKSRTGKGMIHVAYRGIHVESLRDAYLVRVSHDLQASLFFDVMNLWQKAEKNGTEDILLHRFERGAKVPRVLYPERGAHKDIVYYTIFGPTIIATNEGVHRILETRALPINMPATRKAFESAVTPELALPLKERLVAFRARYLCEKLPELSKPAHGRLGDILKPLLQIIRLVRPEREESFRKLATRFQDERRTEKSDSLEAQLLAVIRGLANHVENQKLAVKVITDKYNRDRNERSQISYQLAGRRLKALGFRKVRLNDGASAIYWDADKAKHLAQEFGIAKESKTAINPADESEVSEVSEVLHRVLA